MSVVPAGEGSGEALDDRLVVSWHRVEFGIEDEGAVGPEAIQADGEELQDLAGVVLIGNAANGDVAIAVPEHIEIPAHGGMERDRLEERAVIGEGIVGQRVVVRGERPGIVIERADG